MSGISSKALSFGEPGNKRGFNGNEIQNKEFSDGSGLETMDFNFRMYDHQLGRFWQQDPLTMTLAQLSPYQFTTNNPILFSDPFGLDTVRVNGAGHHQIKIGNGDVLAVTVDGSTGYYNYKDGNYTSTEEAESTSNLPDVTVTTSKKSSSSLATLSFLAGSADLGYYISTKGYDHNNYITTKGILRLFPTTPFNRWSKQARMYRSRSNAVELTGFSLSLISTTLTAIQVQQQYEKGGPSSVNPVDYTSLALGGLGLSASVLKYLKVTPQAMNSVSGFAGIGGLGIGTYQNWMGAFNTMYNTKLPPAYSGDQQFVDDDFWSDCK
jgi:RHS repeat-associated protein